MKMLHTGNRLEVGTAARHAIPLAPDGPESDAFRRLLESLSLEKLLVDISTRLISAPIDAIDGEIVQALYRVREFFQVDRCVLIELLGDSNFVRFSHASHAEGVDALPGDINLAALFPWAYEKLFVQGIQLNISSVEDFPPEADTDRQSFVAMGFRSVLDIPLFSGDRVSHVIAIENPREGDKWPDEFIPRLHLLGEICVNAILRKKSYLTICESEARLGMAADAANVGLWSLDIGNGSLWATDMAWALFGAVPESTMDFKKFLLMVHPEDRERVEQAVGDAIRSGGDASVEYRAQLSDGSVRWLVSRGRLYSTSGEPVRLMGVTLDISERKQMEGQIRSAISGDRGAEADA